MWPPPSISPDVLISVNLNTSCNKSGQGLRMRCSAFPHWSPLTRCKTAMSFNMKKYTHPAHFICDISWSDWTELNWVESLTNTSFAQVQLRLKSHQISHPIHLHEEKGAIFNLQDAIVSLLAMLALACNAYNTAHDFACQVLGKYI